jgi:hypothetical protein
MLQVLLALSGTVEVPPEQLADNRASSTVRATSDEMPFLVKSGVDEPTDSYAAVAYDNHWFWIEDTDFRSKRADVVLITTALSESASRDRPCR